MRRLYIVKGIRRKAACRNTVNQYITDHISLIGGNRISLVGAALYIAGAGLCDEAIDTSGCSDRVSQC